MERVVGYSLPLTGHLVPMVELAKKLISDKPSLSFTILSMSNPIDPDSLSSYISSAFPSITFQFPPYPLLLCDPSNYDSGEQLFFEILHSNNHTVCEFLHTQSSCSHISAFILDVLCYIDLNIPKSFNIPTYFYFSTNASALALFLNFPEFNKIATDSFQNLGETLFEVPGLLSVPANSMLGQMLDQVVYDEFVNVGANLPKCDGIIINTVESFEPQAVKALREGVCLPGTPTPPIYCIGLVIGDQNKGGQEGEGERHECLSWLNSQPGGSVVYLGFGSMGWFAMEQTREIAIGLERSGVRFLWVIRATPSEDRSKWLHLPVEPELNSSILPSGFLERTKDRGLVV